MLKIASLVMAACLAFTVAPVATSVLLSSTAEAKGKGPGSCGTFMYWKSGKCLDARSKVAKK